MRVFRSNEEPAPDLNSIFLAGPSPRDGTAGWRETALEIFEKYQFRGDIYIPLPFAETYAAQVRWENTYLSKATCILFWIPRDLESLPGFTTNIEFGEWMKSGKVVLGYPKGAPKLKYLNHKAEEFGIPVSHTLEGTIAYAIHRIS